MTKQKIVDILIKRDELDEEEAKSIVNDCQNQIDEALACGREHKVEDILADCLGLELDYVYAFM